eukprot:CAMPEP_0117685230 /NCGR_PEP_ID=MMETSP0804-20121206/21614_1 /TAXON_ID=1074897 /ORGANISM="Tetraselmis astigmatica, Strain CCMP880" /LENGTH=372 /DNA_ID=CAMNT_0005496459 /DNA_START=162 /DNA_END=1276 /DNA_ORIENTATION=+
MASSQAEPGNRRGMGIPHEIRSKQAVVQECMKLAAVFAVGIIAGTLALERKQPPPWLPVTAPGDHQTSKEAHLPAPVAAASPEVVALRRQVAELRAKLAAAWGGGPLPWEVPLELLANKAGFFNRGQWITRDQHHFLAKGLVLDIGPKHNPLIRNPKHPNARFLDHGTREEIAMKYWPGEDQAAMRAKVPFIHYAWRPGVSYKELVGNDRFGLIYASHVIEHVADLVQFIREAADILEPDGEFRLVVPDKRFCFDFRRRMSTMADVMSAHLDHCAVNPVSTAYDEHTLIKPKYNSATPLWEKFPEYPQDGDPEGNDDRAIKGIRDFLAKTENRSAGHEGFHRWQFIPSSFVNFVLRLHRAGLIPLTVKPGSV